MRATAWTVEAVAALPTVAENLVVLHPPSSGRAHGGGRGRNGEGTAEEPTADALDR